MDACLEGPVAPVGLMAPVGPVVLLIGPVTPANRVGPVTVDVAPVAPLGPVAVEPRP